MITLRKRLVLSGKARTMLTALTFLGCATLTAAGGEAVAALCLVPAGLALEATRPQPEGTCKHV